MLFDGGKQKKRARYKLRSTVFVSDPFSSPLPLIDMCSALLEYSPKKRFTAWDSLTHTFFDELRNPDTRLPNKQPLPELFNFTDRELKYNPSKNSLLLAKSGGEGVVAGEGSGSASKE